MSNYIIIFAFLFSSAHLCFSQHEWPAVEAWPRVDEWPHNGAHGANTRFFWVVNLLDREILVEGSLGNYALAPGDTSFHEVSDGAKSNRIQGRYSSQKSGPFSLMEWTLSGWDGQDYYNISLVDGYNLPVRFFPIPGTFEDDDEDFYTCSIGGCTSDLLLNCPEDLKKTEGGEVVSCLSACARYGQDEYCCAGAHDVPQNCNPEDWDVNYTQYFKDACPTAYSYAYDDFTSLFRCPPPNGGTRNGPDYMIIFGFEEAAPIRRAPEYERARAGFSPEPFFSVTDNRELSYDLSGAESNALRFMISSAAGEWISEYEITSPRGRLPLNLKNGNYLVSLRSGDRELKSQAVRLAK